MNDISQRPIFSDNQQIMNILKCQKFIKKNSHFIEKFFLALKWIQNILFIYHKELNPFKHSIRICRNSNK